MLEKNLYEVEIESASPAGAREKSVAERSAISYLSQLLPSIARERTGSDQTVPIHIKKNCVNHLNYFP